MEAPPAYEEVAPAKERLYHISSETIAKMFRPSSFFAQSHVSRPTVGLVLLMIAVVCRFVYEHPTPVVLVSFTVAVVTILVIFCSYQQKWRHGRIDKIKHKHGFNDNRDSYWNMTISQAQEIERNIAEWEFPLLYQSAWICGFLKVYSTDRSPYPRLWFEHLLTLFVIQASASPGLSRAICDVPFLPMRPDIIALLTAAMANPVGSQSSSLAIACINAHVSSTPSLSIWLHDHLIVEQTMSITVPHHPVSMFTLLHTATSSFHCCPVLS